MMSPQGESASPREGPRTVASGTSLRQLARLIGVSEKAVRKALQGGVFKASVRRDADGPVVVDVNLAVQEWERSGRRLRGSVRPPAIATSPPIAPAPSIPESAGDAPAGDDEDLPVPPASDPTLVEAQRLTMLERGRKLRLENDLREGKLVEADDAMREAFEFARTVRENVLNVPARLAAELAADSDATHVQLRLEAALREALESTAGLLENTAARETVDG